MSQKSIPVVYMRGGTSRALFFHQRDLPALDQPGDYRAWDPIFTAALGSPDPNGRQLDGMGGGISSLSKVAVIGPASRPDANIDYTFAQVAIREPLVGYRGNCGNISSAVGPFAVDEGLIPVSGDRAEVRIHNTNTGKIIVARFPLEDGQAAVNGHLALQGVSGTGAEIELVFTDPGGATTGKLLPTGNTTDTLNVSHFGEIQVSLVDAANPVVFLQANAIGLTGLESPEVLTGNPVAMELFEEIRAAAAYKMGLVTDLEQARTELKSLPLVCLLSPTQSVTLADGTQIKPCDIDLVVRMISSGQPHKATPLTAAMCLAIAAQIPGTVPHTIENAFEPGSKLRICHPGGILPVDARVREQSGHFMAEQATVFRTARRLMDGRVYIPTPARSAS